MCGVSGNSFPSTCYRAPPVRWSPAKAEPKRPAASWFPEAPRRPHPPLERHPAPASATRNEAWLRGLSAPAGCASVLFHMAPSGEESSWKALAELSSIGMTLVLATVIGLAGGYYLDRWLGTSPWLIMIGLGLGIGAGFVNFFRSVKRAGQDTDDVK